MTLYSYIKPYLDQLECNWFATKEVPCFDLNFGDSNFSIRFSLQNSLVKMTISMDETDNTPRPKSMFTSNLCSEIVYGTQDFIFDLQYEHQLGNYLRTKGIEELLSFNKQKIASDFSGTFYHMAFNDKIYNLLSDRNLKEILMSETRYSKSLLYLLMTFDDKQDNTYLLRSEKEHIEAFNSFKQHIETESSKGIRALFMYNRLQNNVGSAKPTSIKRAKI